MKALWTSVLVLFATGCATMAPRFRAEPTFAELPRVEQQRYAACRADMDEVCAPGDAACVDTRAREYAARGSERLRQRFLIANGCTLEHAGVRSAAEARFAVVSHRREHVELPAIEQAEPVVLPTIDLAVAEDVRPAARR